MYIECRVYCKYAKRRKTIYMAGRQNAFYLFLSLTFLYLLFLLLLLLLLWYSVVVCPVLIVVDGLCASSETGR